MLDRPLASVAVSSALLQNICIDKYIVYIVLSGSCYAFEPTDSWFSGVCFLTMHCGFGNVWERQLDCQNLPAYNNGFLEGIIYEHQSFFNGPCSNKVWANHNRVYRALMLVGIMRIALVL